MVQYAEIKEVEFLILRLESKSLSQFEITQIIYHLKKYHTILEGWYGDEQYHKSVDLEEAINL